MKVEMEAYLEGVMEAVNDAPDGAWIAGSEEQVRDLSAEFRRQTYERAVQMKVDAAEAAFPPSAQPTTGKQLANKGQASQNSPFDQWADSRGAALVARAENLAASRRSMVPLDQRADTITRGVRELCCRLNQFASSFDKAADNLDRAAQVKLCGEQLRLIVESEGRAVLAAQHAIAVPTAWKATDCRTKDEKSRVYTGCDGVMVPLVTEAEKAKRRQKVREKRRRRGRKSSRCRRVEKGPISPTKNSRWFFFTTRLPASACGCNRRKWPCCGKA